VASYYDVLGVPRDTTPEQIRKAYKRKAHEHHPDKGGDHNEFVLIQHAYEILSDPNKRAVYDQTGRDGSASSKEEAARTEFMSLLRSVVDDDTVPDHVNILVIVREVIKDGIRRHVAQGIASRRKSARLKKVLRRFKNIIQEDPAYQMVYGMRRSAIADRIRAKRSVMLLKAVLEIANGYEYEAEEPTPRATAPAVFWEPRV